MTALTALRSSFTSFIKLMRWLLQNAVVLQLSHDVNLYVNISYLAFYCYLHHSIFSLLHEYFCSFYSITTFLPPNSLLLFSSHRSQPSWTVYKPNLHQIFLNPTPLFSHHPPVSSRLDPPLPSRPATPVSFFKKDTRHILLNPSQTTNTIIHPYLHKPPVSYHSRLLPEPSPTTPVSYLENSPHTPSNVVCTKPITCPSTFTLAMNIQPQEYPFGFQCLYREVDKYCTPVQIQCRRVKGESGFSACSMDSVMWKKKPAAP